MTELELMVEECAVRIPAGSLTIEVDLNRPDGAYAAVLFAHGSGSSRYSPRNRYVAHLLNEAKLATLLVDRMTYDEETIDRQMAHLRCDTSLSERLIAVTDWLARYKDTRRFPIGYFGASTGAAAALVASVKRPQCVGAIVSRGGRPDLAAPALPFVQSPTLLIVGENDVYVVQLRQAALSELRCEKRLVVIPGATHLFEETGALDEVARVSCEWLERHLRPAVQVLGSARR